MCANDHFPPQTCRREGYFVSTDPQLLDVDVVHHYLAEDSYWAAGVARATVERGMRHALCFGLYTAAGAQVGFARVVTDFATFAYLADVFVLRPYRGQGLGKWLIACILAHPELQGLRRWTLSTRDAHGFYAPFGFQPNPKPENQMIFRPPPAENN